MSLGLFYDILSRRKRLTRPIPNQIASGVIIGAIAIVLMLTPVNLGTGIFFDTRTILLSLTGLYFGALPTAVAMVIAAVYRLSLAGGGAPMGVATIITSGCIGLAWRHYRSRESQELSHAELYLFGVVVHAVMILCMFLLPQDTIIKALQTLALPIMIVYPVCSTLLGKMLSSQRRRHRMEDELQASEERYRTVANYTYDWEYWLSPDARFIYCSPACERITGYRAKEFESDPELLKSITHPDDTDLFALHVEEATRSSSLATHELEFRIITRSGEVRWIAHACLSVWGEDGAFLGRRASNRDISERKQSEVTHNRLQEQLHQAQRLDSIGRLAGGIAHDFNNKLTVILGYAELSKMRQCQQSSECVENIDEIIKAAQHSQEITRRLMAFSRIGTVNPHTLDVNDVLHDFSKTLGRMLGEQIYLEFAFQDNLWPVRIDPTQLDQVITNLVVNARDSMPDGGTISVHTMNTTVDGSDPAVPKGEYVLISCSDTGCGMDNETMQRIFEPFFTSKEVGKGTGLGLASVYGIITQFNGYISVRSTPGHGSTFTLYLPRCRECTEL